MMYSDEQIRQLILNFEGEYSNEWNQWMLPMSKLQDERFLKFVLEMLNSEDDKQVDTALSVLLYAPQFHKSDLLPQILPFLDNPLHWTNVIKLLTNIGDSSVMPRLFAFLSSPDLEARQQAFMGIFRLGHPDILEICLHLIHDADIGMRMSACLGLGWLNNSPAVEPLIGKLKDNARLNNWSVSASAASALGEIKDTRAVEPLMNSVRFGDEFLSNTALNALWQIEGDKLEYFYLEQLHHPYQDTRQTAIYLLADIGIGKDNYVDLLFSIAQNDSDYDTQVTAADALEIIGTKKAKEAYQNWQQHNKRKS